MQAELERTAEEEAEHKAKQKEKAQTRSDGLAAVFASSNEIPADTFTPAAKAKPSKPKPKASSKVAEKTPAK